MKKITSLVIAVIMLVMLVPTVVFADEATPTIQIATWDGTAYSEPSGNYTSIDSAASAAGTHGKIIMSAGDFYFNSRQTIAVNQITLVGQTDASGKPATHFVTGPNYINASQTNRKSLLTIAAENVTVENIAFNGGEYGRTLEPVYGDKDTEFSVVRVNSGSATFSNVSIEQSQRTLLTIGTSSSAATFVATNFYCYGNNKTIPKKSEWTAFADIDVTNGSFSCTSGELNAYLQVDNDGNVINMPAYHYTLTHKFLELIELVNVKTTAKHFVDSYNYIVSIGGSVYSENIGEFATIVEQNIGTNKEVTRMVDDMCNHPSDFGTAIIDDMITLLTDIKDDASFLRRGAIQNLIDRLVAITPAN